MPDVVADPESLLTTGAVARLLGSSRQQVVDLCERGVLPWGSVGTHDAERIGLRRAIWTLSR